MSGVWVVEQLPWALWLPLLVAVLVAAVAVARIVLLEAVRRWPAVTVFLAGLLAGAALNATLAHAAAPRPAVAASPIDDQASATVAGRAVNAAGTHRPRTPAPAGGGRRPGDPATVGATPVQAGATVAGVATWYCNADRRRGPVSRCTEGFPDRRGPDLYAAIRRSDLELRGQLVRVCAAGRCVVARIIDCNCARGSSLIDLYGDAFDQLAPLAAGRIRVTVAPVVPPATDTAP